MHGWIGLAKFRHGAFSVGLSVQKPINFHRFKLPSKESEEDDEKYRKQLRTKIFVKRRTYRTLKGFHQLILRKSLYYSQIYQSAYVQTPVT